MCTPPQIHAVLVNKNIVYSHLLHCNFAHRFNEFTGKKYSAIIENKLYTTLTLHACFSYGLSSYTSAQTLAHNARI